MVELKHINPRREEMMTLYEDVKNISTEEYFRGNHFAIDAFDKKYTAYPGESYVNAIKRVCDFIASAEKTEELREYWSRRWFDEIYNDWWHPAGSIMQGAGSGRKVSLMNCFSRDTRFITKKGVKSFKDFQDGDSVEVLTSNGGFHEAIVRSFGKQKLFNITVTRNNITKEFLVTENHVWRTITDNQTIILKETRDLVSGDRLPYTKRKWMMNSKGERQFCPIGFIHGLVFGDGAYLKHNDTCSLELFEDSKEFTHLFQAMGYDVKEFNDGNRIMYLPNYMKQFPNFDSVNSEYVLGFIMGWFAADGTIDENGRAELYHKDSSNLEIIKDVIESLGIYSSQIRLVRNHNPFDNQKSAVLYGLHFIKDSLFESFFAKSTHRENYKKSTEGRRVKQRDNWKVVSVTPTDVSDVVWCVQVPDVENFTLECGVNTHNCTTISMGTIREEEEWDNLESIIKNVGYTVAKAAAYRQGLGIDFSRLRPRKSKVLNSANESTGSVDWMRFIDGIAMFVGQKGRIPAMLFSLSVKHPDIEEFITVKSDYTKIQNANISVQITNDFYRAVEEDAEWELFFEIPEVKKGDRVYIDVHSTTIDSKYDKEKKAYYYNSTHDRPKEIITKMVSAKKILELIAQNMATNAEPGIQNIDIARKYSNSDYVYDPDCEYDSRIISTNACSEQYLSRDSLCVLASLNFGRFSTVMAEYEEELSVVGESMNRFLDNVNEMELRGQTYATPFQRMAIEYLRRTGAGYTNIEAWLFRQGLEYGTIEANEAVENFTKIYNYYLYKSSMNLGAEKGNFKLFSREKFIQSPFVNRMMNEFPDLHFETMRNVTCSSIAPTGSLSLMFRDFIMSYGIEKGFGMYFWKRTRIAGYYEYYFCVPNVVREVYEKAGYPIPMEADTIRDTWDGSKGSVIAEFIEKHKKDVNVHYTEAVDVNPLDKLDLMSRVMKWIDSSISVTYMLPQKTDWKDVYNFILEAYRREVKSIAAFPDKKMYGIVSQMPFKELAENLISEGVVIHPQNFTEDEQKVLGITEEKIQILEEKKRPKELQADVYSVTARGEKFCIAVGLLNGQPYEVFGGKMNGLDFKFSKKHGKIIKVKKGVYRLEVGDELVVENFQEQFDPEEQFLFRFISQSLRYGVPLEATLSQLQKSDNDITSLPTATSRVLRKYLKEGVSTGDKCPRCGNALIHSDGCAECSCGYSKCM